MQIESANKQHPIPQNVMDVEFKLIGDLTVRQFSYLVVFGILILITAKTGLPGIFKYPILLIETLAGLGFAFFPMNDITLDKWVINYINAIKNPRLRVWKHKINIPSFFTLDTTKRVQNTSNLPTQNQRRVNIDDFFADQKTKAPSQNQQDFEDESDLNTKEQEFFTKLGVETKNTNPSEVKPSPAIHFDELESKQQFVSHTSPVTSTQTPIAISNKTKPENKIQIKVNYKDNLEEMNQLKDKLIKEIEKNKYKIIEGKEESFKDNIELKNLGNQIVYDEPLSQNTTMGTASTTTTPGRIITEQSSEDAPKPKTPSETQTEKQKPPEEKKVAPTTKPEKSESIFSNFMHSLSSNKANEEEQVPEVKLTIPKPKVTVSQSKKNIISGTAEDKLGNLLPDCIIIIKDSDNEPVRALKTNNLGQFETATSIENAEYKIEGIKEGYKFTPVPVSALGNNLDPVKLIGEKV